MAGVVLSAVRLEERNEEVIGGRGEASSSPEDGKNGSVDGCRC